jgi:hypothetical protein
VTRPPTAGARALVVGVLAPALGALAHLGAGGGLHHGTPALGAVAVLVAAVAAVAALLVRFRRGLLPVLVALGGGQVAWHLALAGPGGDGMAAMADMAGTAVPGPAMIGAHAATTLVIALGVVGVEGAVALLVAGGVAVDAALRRLGTRPTGPPRRLGPRLGLPRFHHVPPRPAPLRRAPGRRGPPVCA